MFDVSKVCREMFADGLLEPVVDPFREDLWDGVDAANNRAELTQLTIGRSLGSPSLWSLKVP